MQIMHSFIRSMGTCIIKYENRYSSKTCRVDCTPLLVGWFVLAIPLSFCVTERSGRQRPVEHERTNERWEARRDADEKRFNIWLSLSQLLRSPTTLCKTTVYNIIARCRKPSKYMAKQPIQPPSAPSNPNKTQYIERPKEWVVCSKSLLHIRDV